MDPFMDLLVEYLIFAIVLEATFDFIFKWRIFRENFDDKGVKTPLIFILCLLVCWAFDVNLYEDLAGLESTIINFSSNPTGNTFSYALTAMFLGGGSSGINNVLHKLKFRVMPEKVAS